MLQGERGQLSRVPSLFRKQQEGPLLYCHNGHSIGDNVPKRSKLAGIRLILNVNTVLRKEAI